MAIQRYHHSYSFYCRPFMVIWKTRLQRYFLNVVVGANLPREIVAAIYADALDEDDVYDYVPLYAYQWNILRVYPGQIGIAYS